MVAKFFQHPEEQNEDLLNNRNDLPCAIIIYDQYEKHFIY